MKVQCPACREIVEMAEFSTSGEGLSFVCPGCKAQNFLPNPRQSEAPAEQSAPVAPAEPALKPGEIICPKCGHSQYDPEACHRCGLMFDKFDPVKLPPDPAEAASVWDLVCMKPDDEELHERFISECQKADRLDFATRHYRLWSREPGRREMAEKMLSLVAQKGQSQIAPAAMAPRSRGESKRTGKILIWIIVGIGLGLLAYYVLRVSKMVGPAWP